MEADGGNMFFEATFKIEDLNPRKKRFDRGEGNRYHVFVMSWSSIGRIIIMA